MKHRISVFIQALAHQFVPAFKTKGAAGADLVAAEDAVLEPGRWKSVAVGFSMQIPDGYVALIKGRSGLALSRAIGVLGGVIDSDYTGPIKAILINHGDEPFLVAAGERIAQVVFVPCAYAEFIPTDTLASTERGARGFGHTGVLA